MARRPRKTPSLAAHRPHLRLFCSRSVLASVEFLAAEGPADSAASVAIAGFESSGNGGIGSDSNDLYLEVIVNGAPKGLAQFGSRDGEIYASAATLRKFGFRLAADNSPIPVRLSGLPGVHLRYDTSHQSLNIEAPLQLLDLPDTVLNAQQVVAPKVTTSLGVLLNYDLYGTVADHDAQTLNLFNELRAFSSLGVLSTTELTQLNHAGVAGWQDRSVRLDTTWTTSFPDQTPRHC